MFADQNKTKIFKWLIVVTISFVALLSTCFILFQSFLLNQRRDIAYTAAAETIIAQLTLYAGKTAVAELTQIAQNSIPTAIFLTPTATESIPPPPTPTPLPPILPTPTSPAILCDQAQFITDISAPPGSNIPGGTTFTKTWRIQNTGSCIWTSEYTLEFVNGESMGPVLAYPLPNVVQPEQILDLSINQYVPMSPGTLEGNWMLRNPYGFIFDTGPNSDFPLQVLIQSVIFPGHEVYAYDFGVNFCSAQWQSDTGFLGCPGSSSNPNGSIVLLDSPNLESRVENQMALWSRPSNASNSWLSGSYPGYLVKDNDHFKTEIGCLNNSPGCDVTFQIDYQTSDGFFGSLGSWRETFNGQTTLIDFNLRNLVGQIVRFSLNVSNNGIARDANAFWLAPRIETGPEENVINWQKTDQEVVSCDELIITLTSQQSAEARAYSCSRNRRELGAINLSNLEVLQVRDWVNELDSFDAEIYQATQVEPIITNIVFYGLGKDGASNEDIQDINTFCEDLFFRIIQ
jgi:hypothetical protein